MRKMNLILVFIFLSVFNTLGQDQMLVNTRASVSDIIPSDNTLRYYRLAIPVTRSAYVEDLDENYNNVLQFWRECEEFANRMFVPLGICFEVVEDERLVKADYFPNEESESFIYTLQANGTSNTNDLIGDGSYDVGMWVHHRDVAAENSGLSAEGGVYSSSAKGSGYSKTDKWVVAHELGHMFGAPHTTTGEGSLMDSGGDDFFSYPSIKKIRDLAVEKGAGSANNAVKVVNSAPVFVNANMKDSYRIPQGACIAIPVYANDADGNILTYSAIGCSSSTVGNVIEGGDMPHFASVIPQTDNIIDYRPKFTADKFYNDFYYEQSGTNIPAMSAGSYDIAILVNDVPASMKYDYLVSNPFYSNYAVWDATVQIVGGTSFNASMSPVKNSYSAGEQVTVSWGVNSNYFTADSRLRITMSTDYGKTFAYVLADDVPALDGSKAVTLPNINVGNIDVDFKTATRSMRGGIIRVEEIGGVAYTLTILSPENGGGFNITGGGDAPMTYTISVTAGDGGTASIDGKSSTTVAAGSRVTLTATPNDGYIFDAWYNGGRFVSLEAEYTFTPTASGTYNAQFVKEAGTPVTYKITATASPAAGGIATVNGSASATVEANGTIELSAKANDGYTFVNWTSGGKEVTTQADYKIYNVAGDADYIANFKEEAQAGTFPDGAYKIFWQQNGRGYLAYHTNYPHEAKLADVTLGNYSSSHFSSTSPEVDLVWYLITADDGKRYLFHAASGKFLIAGTSDAGANAKANKLSTTEALPIRIEKNTAHSDYYVIMANVNNNDALLSSGCGTPSASGSPVRWWYDNGNKDFMSDGGSPLVLIPVNNVDVDENIMNSVNTVINGAGAIELTAGYYKFKNAGSGKYLTSQVNAMSGNRLVMGEDDNIFYYDESSLLSYTEGQYVGIAQTGNVYNVTLNNVTTEPATAKVAPSAGTYYISLEGMDDYGNGVRFIYGNADDADSGTQDSGYPNDAGYKWSVEEITELPVKIGKTGWATIYAAEALEIPAGVVAYYIEKENIAKDYIILTPITDNTIPASMGVILYAEEAVGEEKIYNFAITESSSSYNTNLLEGSIAKSLVTSEAYVLSEQNGAIGLYKAMMNLTDNSAFLNNGHKAYLPIAELSALQPSNGWRFVIDGDSSTAVDEIHNNTYDEELYDLTGRKLKSTMHQGIYISNGKKIYIR